MIFTGFENENKNPDPCHGPGHLKDFPTIVSWGETEMALLGVGAVGSRLPASRIGAVWPSVAGRAVGNHPAAWAGKEGVTKKDGGGTGLEVKPPNWRLSVFSMISIWAFRL